MGRVKKKEKKDNAPEVNAGKLCILCQDKDRPVITDMLLGPFRHDDCESRRAKEWEIENKRWREASRIENERKNR